jgi:hypothetical protein
MTSLSPWRTANAKNIVIPDEPQGLDPESILILSIRMLALAGR